MRNCKSYVDLSLELHLFYARIMKEHAIFLEAGFTPKNARLAKEADDFKLGFEEVLMEAVRLSQVIHMYSVLNSQEAVTGFTLDAEEKTQFYTGIKINTRITMMEKELMCKDRCGEDSKTMRCVRELNKRAAMLIEELINFKTMVLHGVETCQIATTIYPSMLEHILEEAKSYQLYLKLIEDGKDIEDFNSRHVKKSELFWNEIMMEHALFIRGMLDPSENKLICTAQDFANDYYDLIDATKEMTENTLCPITEETLKETKEFKAFKEAGVEGILECKIKSVIQPLLADHVLREANHYIRLLKTYKDR